MPITETSTPRHTEDVPKSLFTWSTVCKMCQWHTKLDPNHNWPLKSSAEQIGVRYHSQGRASSRWLAARNTCHWAAKWRATYVCTYIHATLQHHYITISSPLRHHYISMKAMLSGDSLAKSSSWVIWHAPVLVRCSTPYVAPANNIIQIIQIWQHSSDLLAQATISKAHGTRGEVLLPNAALNFTLCCISNSTSPLCHKSPFP